MKISILQILVDENPILNLKRVLDGLQQAASEQADLAVLPELWSVPFVLESIRSHQEDWERLIPSLQEAAKRLDLWIVGGTIPRKENGMLFNSCPVIDDQGQLVAIVDKCHLLEIHTPHHDFYESEVFTPGKALSQISTPWGKLGILICYDNRFPEAARLVCEEAKFLIAPANFNAKIGALHWKPLFQTRAFENEVFVVAVNPAQARYGSFESYGHSMIIDPQGKILLELNDQPQMASLTIDLDRVNMIRDRSPLWKLRRKDLYSLHSLDPFVEENSENMRIEKAKEES